MIELKDGEFHFSSRIAGNSCSLYGKCDFDHNKRKWVALIEGNIIIGIGDDSMSAIIDVIKKWAEN